VTPGPLHAVAINTGTGHMIQETSLGALNELNVE